MAHRLLGVPPDTRDGALTDEALTRRDGCDSLGFMGFV